MSKNYSIVYYLEGKSKDRIQEIQEKLFTITGSRKCLDSWIPHLTLGSGIIIDEEQQEKLDEAFQKLANIQESFNVKLFNFGGTTEWKPAEAAKATPYVLWINVEVNERLKKLFNLVADAITSKYDTFYPRIKEYIPHVTVAYSDLTKDGYEKGKKYLETINFEDEIRVSHIALVENFPDKDVEYKRFYFKSGI